MSSEPIEKETVEAKLGLLDFKKHAKTHISIKNNSESSPCVSQCTDKPCVKVCPAKVYEWEPEQKKILVAYENCIECGACRMLCPFDNIICDWPAGGHGIKYKFG